MAKRISGGTPLRQVALAKKRRAAEQKESGDKVTLETILGITCYSGAGLSASETCVAYPAGCVAVLFHPKGKGKQVHIRNRKPISCLCFSPNGSYLATGEFGHEPCVRVWDVRSNAITQVCRLKEHHFGVQCVTFSPSGKHLVSVGYQHDRQIIVWNWKAGTKLVHGKFANKVNGVAFSLDRSSKLGSNYFVTVHNRRVQFWYYNPQAREGETLKSRSAILGELQQNNFVAVCCGRGVLSHCVYALTRSGQLCLFGRNRTLERFTETKTSPAYSLALNDQYLFCGCSDGVIRMFDPHTLDYVATMPHPHPLGVNLASIDSSEKPETDKQVYPDAIAMVVNDNRLSTVYNDHSVFVWDLTNVKQIGVLHSFLFHSAGVWDICTYPMLEQDSAQLLPPSCFITCSSDGTVRFWSLGTNKEGAWSHGKVYSKELLRIIYSEPDQKLSLKDSSDLPGSATMDSSKGVRCIQVRPDGQHIAAGDRMGNLAVYDLQFMDEVYREIAHDAEILSLSYSPIIGNNQFLSSSSRDRMVHIFSLTSSSYEPIQSLTDHSAAVTAIQYVRSADGTLQLLSSGADKSIIFHSMDQSQETEPTFNRTNNVVSKATIYDMDVDVFGKHVVTAGQDRVLRFYLVNGGKQKTVIKAPTADSEGSLLKVALDPSGLFAATSCADKSVLIFDVFSGECVAKLTGHSELVTQVRFSQDCKFLYSVSGDSCIFVWKLSRKMMQAMHNRLSELGLPLPSGRKSPLVTAPATRETYVKIRTSTPHAPRVVSHRETVQEDESVDTAEPDFDYHMSILPSWDQRESVGSPTSLDSPAALLIKDKEPVEVEGKWAERVESGGLVFAIQDQDSDVELEDLSAEMSRIVFERQSVMEVIDLTRDDEEVVSISHVIEAEGHVIETKDHVTEDSNDSKSSEEEVKFFTTSDDIDPSLFSVTTPIKLSTNDSEDDESPRDSPADSPLPPTKVPDEDDSSFLKTNFESLEKEEDPHFLNVPSPRQSISAKFLERSLLKTHIFSHAEKSIGDLPVLADTEAAGIVIHVQDAANQEDANQPTPLAPIAQDDGELEGGEEMMTVESEVVTVEDDHKNQQLENSTKMTRRPSFEEALGKTKKLLKELGYPVEHKSTPQETDPTDDQQSDDAFPQPEPESDPCPPPAPTIIGTQKSVTVKPRQAKKPSSSDVESELVSRVRVLTDDLDTTFRTLVELHDQVVSGETQELESDDAVNLIATSLTALKSNVVSMVNRNRRLWRERVKAKSTVSVDTSSLEMDVASESSTHSSEQGITGSSAHSSEQGITGSSAHSSEQGLTGSSAHSSEQGITGSSAHSSEQGLTGSSAQSSEQGITGSSAHSSEQGIIGSSAHSSEQGIIGSSAHSSEQGIVGSSAHSSEQGTTHTEASREGGEASVKCGSSISGDEYVMTVSREDFKKMNDAMRTMKELESNLSPALTTWFNLKQKHSHFNDS